jgi:hypothetical protein
MKCPTAAIAIIMLAPLVSSAQAEDAALCGGTKTGKSIQIARSDATCPWAFDVEQMTISCNSFGPGSGEVFFRSEKGVFALNGNARQSYQAPTQIWLDNPEWEGAKIDVGPWIQVGLDLC